METSVEIPSVFESPHPDQFKEGTMFRSYLSGAVDALERELEYYKKGMRECQDIIKQIHRGYPLPGEPVYIHPYDFMKLVDEIDVSSELYFQYSISAEEGYHQIKGIQYKQSSFMPCSNKDIK